MSRFENNPKCMFFHVVIFLFTLFSAIGLYFLIRDSIVLTVEKQEVWIYRNLKFYLAETIIGSIFLIATHIFNQVNLKKAQYTAENSLRRWILYAGLTIAALFVLLGFINLVIDFLDEKMLQANLLKSFFLILISVSAFGFFFADATRKTAKLTLVQKGIAVFMIAVAMGAVGYGFKHRKTEAQIEQFRKEKEKQSLKNKKTSSKVSPKKSNSKNKKV